MTKYLKGMCHFLTYDQAKNIKKEDEIMKKEKDGTYTIITLSEYPLYPNQSPWKGLQ